MKVVKTRSPRKGLGSGKAVPAIREAPASANGGTVELFLYVAGQTPKSVMALANLERICKEHLDGSYKLHVIDLTEKPQLARTDQILAIPTLVRKLPSPVTKIIGDLSNTEKVLVGLKVRQSGA